MICALDSGKQGTRRAVTPSGKKESPAEGEELNPCSKFHRYVRLGVVCSMNTSFLLARRGSSVRLGELDVLGMDVSMYGRMWKCMRYCAGDRRARSKRAVRPIDRRHCRSENPVGKPFDLIYLYIGAQIRSFRGKRYKPNSDITNFHE